MNFDLEYNSKKGDTMVKFVKRAKPCQLNFSTLSKTSLKVFDGGVGCVEGYFSVPLWSKLNFCSCTQNLTKLT